MNLVLLFKLLLAHVLADFALQTDKICKGKQNNSTHKYLYLTVHSLIHAAAAYAFVGQWSNWILPLVIFVTHFIIDHIKVMSKSKGLGMFIIDQLLHLIVIIVLWLNFCGESIPCQSVLHKLIDSPNLWIIVTAYLIVLKPTSLFLGLFFKKWNIDNNVQNSLPNAGQWIGYLERILILTFVLTHHLEGVGFLLAAKSIFRFGDLNKDKEVKMTEYVLIGTLSSFSIAIILGLLVERIM